MSRTLLEKAALRYARRGFPVLPVHSLARSGRCSCDRASCASPAKHPRTRHGVLDATTNLRIISSWWLRWPDANVGIATGLQSATVVLDVDPQHGGAESIAKIEGRFGLLPNTVEAETGGQGRHLYFARFIAPHVANRIKFAGYPGIDIRSDRGYVIAPPSVHISGCGYTWRPGRDPFTMRLAPIPDWFRDFAHLREPSARTEDGEEIIEEGRRNQTLARMGGALRRQGASAAAVAAALQQINLVQCHPPLDSAEVAAVAKSIARYPLPQPGTLAFAFTHSIDDIVRRELGL